MVLGALAGAEMAVRDVGINIAMGSGVAAAQAHFRKTIMAKEKPNRCSSSEHTICAVDPEVWQAIKAENKRQHEHVRVGRHDDPWF